MCSLEWNWDGIREDNFFLITETFTVGTSDDAKIGLCDITVIIVTDSSKIGEEIDSKGSVYIGVY